MLVICGLFYRVQQLAVTPRALRARGITWLTTQLDLEPIARVIDGTAPGYLA